MEAWPVNDIFPNLIEIASYEGAVYGLPQDAESRPFFAWIPHMKAIGYSDAELAALPERVASGDYTLYDVLEDAKKMQDKGVVQPRLRLLPAPSPMVPTTGSSTSLSVVRCRMPPRAS